MAGNRSWEEGEVLGDKHREHHNDLGYIEEGTGSPEGVVTAPVGSIFLRTDGSSGTTVYIKESGTGNTGWTAIVSAGTIDHGALTGLSDDDHTQYATNTEFDDHSARHENGGADEISLAGLDGTPTAVSDHLSDAADAHDASAISIADAGGDFTATDVEGALAELQQDNEDHVAAADPHTGYRLESADHTHASAGAQAGQLDHGTALTGLTDDDHTQYRLESADHTHQSTGAQAGTLDHGLALTGLTDDDHPQYLKESDVDAVTFTIGVFFDGGGSTLSTGVRPIWRAPFACTVTQVRGYVDTGTTTVINAGTGAASGEDFCSSNITIDPADAWEAGTVNQNQSVAEGETVSVEIVTAGTATQLTIQIELTRDLSP